MSGVDPHAPIETELRDSDPNADAPGGLAGGMGVSSERVGAAGPGQEAANGTRDTSPAPSPSEGDEPDEQRPGLPETNPEGLEPKRTRD
ncbi:MAG: hypothetical protein ABWX84_07535 [Nocardioides sp.]